MRYRSLQSSLLLAVLYLSGSAFPQSNSLYYHENPAHVFVGEEIVISQLLFIHDPVSFGMLYFRNKGEISFQEIPMDYEGGKWLGIIPGYRVTKVGLEYVTILTKRDGGRIALPLTNNPFDNPLFIQVSQKQIQSPNQLVVGQKKSTDEKSDFVDADILILSPEDGSMNRSDELVISASLFNAPNINQSSFQILIDDIDYTSQTIISSDVLSLVPEKELNVGFHQIKILFKTTYGMDVIPVEWSFNINKGMENLAQSFIYKGSLNAKNSSSTVSSISVQEKESSGKFDGELSWIKARYSFRNSSRESSYMQPLNRSTLSLQITDYFKIESGDIYPSVSPYILDGKRVNGRHIQADFKYDFNLWRWEIDGAFEFQFVSGSLTREVQYLEGIDGAYDLLEDEITYNDIGNRIFKINRTGYTFPRDIIASRLGFSLFNKYRGGIHFLKAKDDFDKINIKAPISSTLSIDTTVFGDTTYQYFTLASLIDSLNVLGDTVQIKSRHWDDGTPKENLVLGFDFESALDNRKLLFQMGWNMSMTNSNIWAGFADQDSLDLMMDTINDGMIMGQYEVSKIGENIKKYENFFTIHPLYMTPIIPIDPIVAEKSIFRAILNMPSSAFYFRVKGSYSFNNLLLEYKQLGAQYQSFGNPYLTNNIRDFTINDRLSLLGRRLMIVVGYNYKDNNLSETVINPISTKTTTFNTTLVPGSGAPSIVMNIKSIGSSNGVDSVDTDQLGDSREDSQALNIMGSVNIPGNFENLSTTTSINISSITYRDNLEIKRDNTYFFQKAETQSISFTFSTRFQFPLKTSTSINRTQLFIPLKDENDVIYKDETSWTFMSTTAQYSFLKNKLRINGGLDYMTNGETGDDLTKLYGGKLGGSWDIINKLTLSFNSSIRLNMIQLYKSDNTDNDEDGSVDEFGENWDVNSSGFNLTLGYRF
ncbi:MAG: hypothetical protein HOB93_05600 [Candidatus Marinimicrobia bacterium]|nr:hypothetical protein [Candidatus Neomarinimicrobiota bacterium]MBT5758977.1 hypothetical protein [Candidatus Neomarinimicrobiota bacterium]